MEVRTIRIHFVKPVPQTSGRGVFGMSKEDSATIGRPFRIPAIARLCELCDAGAICGDRENLVGGGAHALLDEGNTFSVGRPGGVSRVITAVACLQEKWIYSVYTDYVHLRTG